MAPAKYVLGAPPGTRIVTFLNRFGSFHSGTCPIMVHTADAFVAPLIRVAVANQPRMIRELIAMSLAQEEDVEVVAQISDDAEISRLIEETKPEFLIVSLDSRLFGPPAREDMLQKHPEIQIMALASDGNSFTLFSASDGIRSMIYKGPEAEILDVMRRNSRKRERA